MLHANLSRKISALAIDSHSKLIMINRVANAAQYTKPKAYWRYGMYNPSRGLLARLNISKEYPSLYRDLRLVQLGF